MGIETAKIPCGCSETHHAVHNVPSHELKIIFWGAVSVHKILGPLFLKKP